MKKSVICALLLAIVLTGCISSNARVGINKDRSVDIVYTSIAKSNAVDSGFDVEENVAQLKKHGFTASSRTKTNGDVVVTSSIHLSDLSGLKTLKINDTTSFFQEFITTISKKSNYDQVELSGKLPVLDPPSDSSDSASSDIKSRLTLKLPYTVTSNDADIVDGSVYEWEGSDAEPVAFHITMKMPKVVVAKALSLNSKAITLGPGDTFTLKTTFTPADVTNKELFYTSANKSIATVSKLGVVKGISVGSTVITVLNSDRTIAKTVNVTVK
jgi:uncharacterized protein YjdB